MSTEFQQKWVIIFLVITRKPVFLPFFENGKIWQLMATYIDQDMTPGGKPSMFYVRRIINPSHHLPIFEFSDGFFCALQLFRPYV